MEIDQSMTDRSIRSSLDDHDGEDELLQIVGDRLEDGLEHGEGQHHVDEQKGVEEGGEEDAGGGAEQVADAVEELTVGQDDTRPQPVGVTVEERGEYLVRVK